MKEQTRFNWYLLFLIIAGAFIRLYNLGNLSLSNDELSAISRALLPNLKELIWNGVHPDAHLIGTHILLFSVIKIFGTDVFFIRLPFALMGIASIYLIYLIGKKWFNEQVGLLCASAICFLEFTVLYSQIARPYIFGFFFVLLFLHGLNYFIFSDNIKWYHTFIFIIGALGAVLNHYFSFLTVLLTGIFGFSLVKKVFIKFYLLCGIIVWLLFLPHLPITLDQISRKGLDSWLEKPDILYFFKFLFYAFNSSLIVVVTLISGFVIAFILKQKKNSATFKLQNKFRFFSICVFLVVFSIGYFYSVLVSPVIQYSVLIFVFPFLLLFIFSYFQQLNKKILGVYFLVFTLIVAISTIAERKFFSTHHFGVFKEIAEQSIMFNKLIGSEKITQTININNPFYIDFYLSKLNSDLKFSSYEFKNDGTGYRKMDSLVKQAKTPFFIHAWSNVFDPYDLHELIKFKYPCYYEVIYFNSNFRVYYQCKGKKRVPIFNSTNTFDWASPEWSGNENTIKKDVTDTLNKVCIVDSNNPYSPNFNAKVKDVFVENKKHILIKANYYLEENASINLVIDFLRDGESYEWYGPSIQEYTNQRNEWKQIIIVKKLPKNALPEDDIKIYFWNSGNVPVKIDNVSVSIFEDTDYSW